MQNFKINLAMFICSLFPAANIPAQTCDPDVQLYANGNIPTMNPKQPHAAAMAVKSRPIACPARLYDLLQIYRGRE